MKKFWLCVSALLLVLLCAACGRQTPPQTTTEDNTVTVTFAEGTTVWQAAKLLEQNGVCTAQAFLDTAAQSDSEYAAVPDADKRPFPLEGYLFPDTYSFYKNASGTHALQKFLDNFAVKWTPAFTQRAEELGMTRDEALTLASIVQTEAGYVSQMPHVSSVLHNRIAKGMKLQCDATYFYLEKSVMPYLCPDGWDDAVYEPLADRYYTYRFAGLPQGPICNPGLDAIRAALYPDDTDDLYFVTDESGNFYYAATYEAHQANCAAVRSGS